MTGQQITPKRPKKLGLDGTIILIIDVQKRILNPIENSESILIKIESLLKFSLLAGIETVFTEQNPLKLGPTHEYLSKYIKSEPQSKMSFSCAHLHEISTLIESNSIKNIIITGIETHICVLQSAIDFLQKGMNVYLAVDCLGSRGILDHNIAIRRLENHGAIITTSESVIFELCDSAEQDYFKKVSKIIKEMSN